MIVIGADTHKRSHTVAAVEAVTGRSLGERTVSARGASFDLLLAWARSHGAERVWAIEDCRHVSGALERFVLVRGEVLSDVLCEVGMTDAALGAGKAIRDQAQDQIQREILVSFGGRREFR